MDRLDCFLRICRAMVRLLCQFFLFVANEVQNYNREILKIAEQLFFLKSKQLKKKFVNTQNSSRNSCLFIKFPQQRRMPSSERLKLRMSNRLIHRSKKKIYIYEFFQRNSNKKKSLSILMKNRLKLFVEVFALNFVISIVHFKLSAAFYYFSLDYYYSSRYYSAILINAYISKDFNLFSHKEIELHPIQLMSF